MSRGPGDLKLSVTLLLVCPVINCSEVAVSRGPSDLKSSVTILSLCPVIQCDIITVMSHCVQRCRYFEIKRDIITIVSRDST